MILMILTKMSLTKILFKRTGEIKIEKIVMIIDLIQSD